MMKILVLLCFWLMLQGCTTTYVEHEPTTSRPMSGATVKAAAHSDSIPIPLISGIAEAVENGLYNNHGYASTTELLVEFKVLEHDDPRGFWSSWWKGQFPDSEKQLLNVGVIFSDTFDTQLAEIEVEVEVGSGTYQTDPSKAVQSIASQIIEYTVRYFPNSSF